MFMFWWAMSWWKKYVDPLESFQRTFQKKKIKQVQLSDTQENNVLCMRPKSKQVILLFRLS